MRLSARTSGGRSPPSPAGAGTPGAAGGAPGRGGAGPRAGAGAAGVRARRPAKNSFRIRASSTASANRTGMSRRSSRATSTSSTLTIWRRRATLAAVSVTISRLPWTTRLPPWTNGRSVAAIRSAGAYWSGHDLGDDLVVAPGGVWLGADDGGQRTLADGRRRQDLVEIPGADGRDAIHLEHRQQDVEDLVLGDPARGLDGDLLAGYPGPDRVVEPGDLAGGLDHGLDVGVVEVQDDLPARSGRRRDGPRRRRRLGRCSRSWNGQRRGGGRGGGRRGGGRRAFPLRASRRTWQGNYPLRCRRRRRRYGHHRGLVRHGLASAGSGPGTAAQKGEADNRDPAARDLLGHSSSVGSSCVSVLGGGAGGGTVTRGRPGTRRPGAGEGAGAGPGAGRVGLPAVGRPGPPASGDCTPGGAADRRGFVGS